MAHARTSWSGLTNPKADFTKLRVAYNQVRGMESCFKPFSPDYLILHAVHTALTTAAYHFTGDPTFMSQLTGGQPGSRTPPKVDLALGLEDAFRDLADERPNWRLTLTDVGGSWLATIRQPEGMGGLPPQSVNSWETTNPAAAVRAAIARARDQDAAAAKAARQKPGAKGAR